MPLRVIRQDQPEKFAMNDAGPEQDVGAASADLACLALPSIFNLLQALQTQLAVQSSHQDECTVSMLTTAM